MTLCLAWKLGEDVYLASDSRLTQGEQILTNVATKIFKISVEIYTTIPEDVSGVPEERIHSTTYGLCFTGSYLNGSILADCINEVLSNIQCTPYSDLSIDNFSIIAFAIYKQVSKQLMEINRKKGLSEVLFGGYCYEKKIFKLFKFSYKLSEKVEFLREEIDLNDKTIFIGEDSAIKKAEELLNAKKENYSHFHILREIIKDESIPSVGGNIQVGVFQLNRFTTKGIIENESFEDEYGILQVKDKYKFKGLELDLDDKELYRGKIMIHKSYMLPFEKERDELFKKSTESINKKEEEIIKGLKNK